MRASMLWRVSRPIRLVPSLRASSCHASPHSPRSRPLGRTCTDRRRANDLRPSWTHDAPGRSQQMDDGFSRRAGRPLDLLGPHDLDPGIAFEPRRARKSRAGREDTPSGRMFSNHVTTPSAKGLHCNIYGAVVAVREESGRLLWSGNSPLGGLRRAR
jgi:hypothetical protein